jgi:4'-phosphopantetheinyl transferase EntD
LQALFPGRVVAVEMQAPGDPATLHIQEAGYMASAAPKRIREYSAGRLCARVAMQAFGIVDFPLHAASDRQPVWPATLVGSISHTLGFCAAVVAPKACLGAIGLDCEVIGHVASDLWETICTAREAAWLHGLPEPERTGGAALIFSAKEAFYKCQYPLTGEWLDFHDLEVAPLTWGATRAEVTLQATRLISAREFAAFPVTGRYLFHEGFVSTGVSFPATV